MAYTLLTKYGEPKSLRFVRIDGKGAVSLADPFTPAWWSCDPCNHSSRRYEVTFTSTQDKPATYAWYEVITTDDDDRTIECKKRYYAQVLDAQQAVNDAKNALHRLVG